MARTLLNPALRLLSGNIAGFIYRHYPDGRVVVARVPSLDPNRQPSSAQVAYRQRFKDASAHHLLLLADPATRAAYERLLAARGPLARLRPLVMGDIMKPPVIRALDLSNYRGTGIIRILAEDNVAVARLALVIYDCTAGQDLETAELLIQADRLAPAAAWHYKATTAIPAGHTIEVRVRACDLAGNQTEACQAL